MNEIKIFENEQFGQIRITGTNENPLFCLTDVCRVLGLTAKHVMERLDKGVVSTDTLPTNGGNQTFNFVNEDGLYDVILDSRKPEAKAFRKWVTSEILPSIRKHGAYMTDEIIERTLTDPDYLIRLATELKNERQRRMLAENDAKLKQRQLTEQQPKVEYYDAVTESEGSESFKVVAQSLKNNVLRVPEFGQNKLIDILREMKIIYGKGNNIYAYQKYVNDGCFEVVNYPFKDKNGKPHIGHKTLITQRGKQFVTKIVKRYFQNKQNNVTQLSLFNNVKM